MKSLRSTGPALVPVLALLLLLGGSSCRKQPPAPTPAPVAPPAAEPAPPAPAPQPVSDFKPEPPVAREAETDLSSVLKTIYFDFDQDTLTEQARATLQSNAQWLRSHGGAKVRIEGNADDRGTIEYNLALGQRRADAVRAYLASLGVTQADLEVVSYGEEKPAVPGSDETSWAQNRRADFVVLSRP